MKTATRQWMSLSLFIITLEAVGGLIGLVTSRNIDNWYAHLEHAPLNPPDWAFGVVWPLLYLLIAVAGWRLWSRRHNPGIKPLIALYIIQLVMNWAWSFIFFSAHLLWPSFIWIVALVIVVAALIALSLRREPVTAGLLLPYLLWIMFASYLSGYIALFNL